MGYGALKVIVILMTTIKRKFCPFHVTLSLHGHCVQMQRANQFKTTDNWWVLSIEFQKNCQKHCAFRDYRRNRQILEHKYRKTATFGIFLSILLYKSTLRFRKLSKESFCVKCVK